MNRELPRSNEWVTLAEGKFCLSLIPALWNNPPAPEEKKKKKKAKK